jgi:D-alanyl-D-alanine carboxypeptidase/D-alanyl-D-alanine-endopeptidase (penicillin-binding protein 4)
MRRLQLFLPYTIVLLFVLLAAVPGVAGGKPKPVAAMESGLAQRVEAILNRPEVARGLWGIEAVDLETGAVVYAHNANQLFTPASNAKMFTTAAGLALVGGDYRFRTTVEASTPPDKYGRIAGDLVLVGRGDPNLSGRALPYALKTVRPWPPEQALAELADQLAARGVRVVDGDLVADDTFYTFERFAEGWTQDDLQWDYGAPVSALSINDNSLFLSVLPAEHVGERAFVTVEPFAGVFSSGTQLVNRVTTTAAGTGPRNVGIRRQMGTNRIELWGTIPADDLGMHEQLAIEDPAEFSARLLAQLLSRRGIIILGGTRARHILPEEATAIQTAASSAHPNPVVLAEHISAPLAQDVRVINKVSQNLHTEMLLRLLGRQKGGTGSVESGLEALKGFLTEAGLKPEEYVFFDGSGLSRKDLITPHAAVTLLRYAFKQPWGLTFRDSLPVAGVDGTLTNRLKDLPKGARVEAKTGTHDHVNTLSGYITTPTGRRLAFSILANNHLLGGANATGVMDEIVMELAAGKN